MRVSTCGTVDVWWANHVLNFYTNIYCCCSECKNELLSVVPCVVALLTTEISLLLSSTYFSTYLYVFMSRLLGSMLSSLGLTVGSSQLLLFCYRDVPICFCGYLIEPLHSSECFLATIVTFMLEVCCCYSAHWFNMGRTCEHREEPLDSLKDRISWQAE